MFRTTPPLKKFDLSNFSSPLFGAVIGAILFISIYGTNVLDFTNTAWIFSPNAHTDIGQHQLGWEFFRTSSWYFPVGLMDNILHPLKLSVVYTDSIPLFAIFFKIFRNLLPQSFQYLGFFGFLSFILQGFFSAKIATRFTDNQLLHIGTVLLFVLNPILINKMFVHTALTAHWLILWAFLLWIDKAKYYNHLRKSILNWGILLSLAISIHMYIAIMILGIFTFYILEYISSYRRLHYPIILLFSITCIVSCILWILGYFYGNISSSGGGLGNFNFNLLQFFNPRILDEFTISRIYSGFSLPHIQQYWEGFSYLGTGILLSLPLFFIHFISSFKTSRIESSIYLLFIFSFTLAATGGCIYIGSLYIGNILGICPDFIINLWEIIRASGRMIWPVYYSIFIGIIKIFSTRIRDNSIRQSFPRLWLGIFYLLIILQLFDITLWLKEKHTIYYNEKTYESSPMNTTWNILTDNYKHLVFVGDLQAIQWSSHQYNLQHFAAQNNLTINYCYTARTPDFEELESLISSYYMDPNRIKDCIFIILDPSLEYLYQDLPFTTHFIDNYQLKLYAPPN